MVIVILNSRGDPSTQVASCSHCRNRRAFSWRVPSETPEGDLDPFAYLLLLLQCVFFT